MSSHACRLLGVYACCVWFVDCSSFEFRTDSDNTCVCIVQQALFGEVENKINYPRHLLMDKIDRFWLKCSLNCERLRVISQSVGSTFMRHILK